MENLGGIIGIVVALGVMAFFRNRNPNATTAGRISQTALAIVVAGIAAGAASYGGKYLRMAAGSPTQSDIERVTQFTRELPLVRIVLADNPTLETRLRAAVEDEVRNPSKRPPPSFLFGAEIRKEFVLPALRRSSDLAALRAVQSIHRLAVHLQSTNLQLCRDFGLVGLQDTHKLDREGRELLKLSLAAQEEAYRDGKIGPSRQVARNDDVAEMLMQAGHRQKDLEHLASMETLSITDACATTVRLYAAPSQLPTPRNAALARWLLTISP